MNRLTASFGVVVSSGSIFFLALWFVCFHPAPSAAQTFEIYTEQFPPYNYTHKDKITGISTEIVREILRKVGHPENIEVSIWSNAYRLVQEKDQTILYSTTRSPNRENLFKWVGPLVPNNTVFFARTGSGLLINSLDDARKVGKIGVYKDDFGEQLLNEKNFTNLRSVQDNKVNVKDLAEGKIDLWIINELTGAHMAKEAGYGNKVEKVFNVQKDFMYMAFNKNTPDAVIEKWQKALDEIKADGTYAQIFSKWIMFSSANSLNGTRRIELTHEEQGWVNHHPVIRMATDPDYPPFQYTDEGGISRGIANDYLALIGAKLGIIIEPTLTRSWSQSQLMVKNREADMVAVAAETPERKEYMLFTTPYVEFPDVIIVRNNYPAISGLDQLEGKTLATVPGFAINDFLKSNYPAIKIVEKPDTKSLVRSVSTGEVDSATLNFATLSYRIEKERIINLRVGVKTGFFYKLSFASRNDWPLLNQILEKALESLTREERTKIERRWVSISEKPWITMKQFLVGSAIVLGIAFVIGIIFWNRQLRHKVELKTRELRASEENFKNLYKTAMVGLYRTSIDGSKIYAANPALAKLFGYEMDEHFHDGFIPNAIYADTAQRDKLIERLHKEGKVEEFEFLGRYRDGTLRTFIVNAFMHEDKSYIEGAILDITERKKNEEVIRKLAMTDPLTGLANRNQFNINLDSAIAYSRRFDNNIALILIDLDSFKPVNDNYGHPVGDKLLKHVARELSSGFRDVDTSARIGGDEFAVVLNGIKSRKDAQRLAENVLKRIATPVEIERHTIRVGASMGICFCPGDTIGLEEMLVKADKGLYTAKTQGKNQICFYEDIMKSAEG